MAAGDMNICTKKHTQKLLKSGHDGEHSLSITVYFSCGFDNLLEK
jgi:hypothetical protein